MSGYNCSLEYIPGTENTCADLLSRKPDSNHVQSDEPFVSDINDNTLEIGVKNSSEIDPKQYASCRIPDKDKSEVPDTGLVGLDMSHGQANDNEILELNTILKHGEPTQTAKRR